MKFRRFRIWGALILTSFLTAEAVANPMPILAEGLVHANIAGQQVRLINDAGRCALIRADDNSLTLDMKWPCHFSIDNQKQPRVEMYNDTPTLMVERSEPRPAPSQDCRTDRQAVRWYRGRLEAARAQHIAMCGPAHWDQKAFFASFKW